VPDNKVVAHGEWLKARLELLAAEKEFTRQRDALTGRSRRKIARGFPPARRRSLPLPESHTKIVFYARTK
jgi:hypothetical protein